LLTRCDYSHLNIPTELSYLDVAGAYVEAVARRLGFAADERSEIGAALRQRGLLPLSSSSPGPMWLWR